MPLLLRSTQLQPWRRFLLASHHCVLLLLLLLFHQPSHGLPSTRYYPLRQAEEAAVIEWGHSAIINALDAVVAEFGPQTSQAALMEVETAPILVRPMDGGSKLENADELLGNVAIVTDTNADMTSVELAKAMQEAGAAAVIVVHVVESSSLLDEAPRLAIMPGEEDLALTIDIPVVSISLSSASVLAMAMLSDEEKRRIRSLDEANGLPER